jgi:hypothetical protein
MWQCHQCHRSYHLAATRRCLDDGHSFCSGTTTVKAWRKPTQRRTKRHHHACASEFDYSGWKAWGRWRRGGLRKSSLSSEKEKAEGVTTGRVSSVKKDCWNTCDYPSECRWGRRFGIHTPLADTFPSTTPEPEPAQHIQEGTFPPTDGTNKPDIWNALIASANRRKSIPPSSPLAQESQQDSSTPIASVAIDMLKDLMKRKNARRGAAMKRTSSYPVPMLTVPKPVVTKRDEEIDGADPEALVDLDVDLDMEGEDDGFAPLVRVESRRDLRGL